jgi:hypothetical protein
MTIEQQVSNLELSKKLCELGVKSIAGHDGYYVSPDGKVFSTKYGYIKELSKSYDVRGYWRTFLSVNGKPKAFITHRLVASAFIKNTKNLPVVNHKDGNKNNNHFENLEWCTREYNEKHSREVLGHDGKGSKNSNFGHRKAKLYPNEKLRNKLCELGIPRYRHNLAELGEMLPKGITEYATNITGKWGWKSLYIITEPVSIPDSFATEADARAKMLIYLLENKLITL